VNAMSNLDQPWWRFV